MGVCEDGTMAELIPSPTRTMPFTNGDILTQRSSEWINIVNLSLTLQGKGAPEGVIEARISQTYIDITADFASPFLYIKQFNDVAGSRKSGWRLIA